MKIHAYQETYLNKAQSVMGDVFDYAVNVCRIDGARFVDLFVASNVSTRMSHGEMAYILGKSGIEIVIEILEEAKGKKAEIELQDRLTRTKEYWIGWAICYYQWYSNRSYGEIFKALSYEELEKMYHTLHEADVTRFVDVVDEQMKLYYSDTNLKRIRMQYGVTQQELAASSGVGLRSIQMYEQRNKDINKASVETIYRLATTLGCSMEDLIEK